MNSLWNCFFSLFFSLIIVWSVWFTWDQGYEWIYVAYAMVSFYQIELNTRRR